MGVSPSICVAADAARTTDFVCSFPPLILQFLHAFIWTSSANGSESVAMHTTPISLLQRLRQPSRAEAWSRFVELYTPLLYYWARRMGLASGEAADLVQDVFVVLLKKLPEFTYDPARSFRAWLRTVIHNKWRENHRRNSLPIEAASAARLAEVADPAAVELDEAEYRQHLVRRMLHIMQTDFQPSTWKAFWEVVACDRPPAEVAAELGLSIKAVYLAKARVLRRLRQELDGLLD